MRVTPTKLGFAIIMLALTQNFRIFIVDANSMRPTLIAGDLVLCARISSISRDDIVVARAEVTQRVSVIKRVAGVPGDVISFNGTFVASNDVALLRQKRDLREIDESAYSHFTLRDTSFDRALPGKNDLESIHVTNGKYFLLGDNRASSTDSRIFGPVPADAIVCEVQFVLGTVRRGSSQLGRIRFL